MLRIFTDLELIDRTDHGVPMIVKKYGKDIFKISKETIRIFIPLNKELLEKNVDSNIKNDILNKTEKKILEVLINCPKTTINDIVSKTNLSESYINKIIKFLKNAGFIKRVGSNKTGYWEVLK